MNVWERKMNEQTHGKERTNKRTGEKEQTKEQMEGKERLNKKTDGKE